MTTSARAARVGNDYWQFNPDARNGRGEYRYQWRLILPAAAGIVGSYKTTGVTLRQLFYMYMQPRAKSQEFNIYVGVEKKGLEAQLFQWFAPLGLPVVALGGYPSQTICDEVAEEIREDGRPAVLIYAGDFDADGEDIPRDFSERVGCFEEFERVALIPEQVEEMNLPPQPGKWTSARAQGFAEKYADLFESVYGLDLVQIELDAIPPTDLRRIYTDAIDGYFDRELWQEEVDDERAEKSKIAELAGIEEED